MCAASLTYSNTINQLHLTRKSFAILPDDESDQPPMNVAATNLPAIVVANKARSVYHKNCIVPNEDYSLVYNAIGSKLQPTTVHVNGTLLKNQQQQHHERLSYPSKEFFNKVSTKLKNLRLPAATTPAASEVREVETKKERAVAATTTTSNRAMEKPMFITTVKSGSFLEPPPEVAALLGLRKNSYNSSLSSEERTTHNGKPTTMYSFASKPRLVKSTFQANTPPRNLLARSENRREKRDTAAASKSGNGNSDGSIHYGNTMYDRRVARGSNFASLRPNVVSTEHVLSRQAEARRRAAVRQRAQIRARKLRMGTPPPIDGRRHEQMQTEKYLEELTERPPEKSIGCQADLPIDADTPSFSSPDTVAIAGTGVDAETQLYPGDLPDFDDDHAHTIVTTIVNKILQEAILEINEEIEKFRSYSYEKTIRGSNWDQREDGNAVIISKEELASLIQTAIRNLKTSDQMEVSVEKLERIQSSKLLEITIKEIRTIVKDVKFLSEIIRTRSHTWTANTNIDATYQPENEDAAYENDFEGDDIGRKAKSEAELRAESRENTDTEEENTTSRFVLVETDKTDMMSGEESNFHQTNQTENEQISTETERTTTGIRAEEATVIQAKTLMTETTESSTRVDADDETAETRIDTEVLETEGNQTSEKVESHEAQLGTAEQDDNNHPHQTEPKTQKSIDENERQTEPKDIQDTIGSNRPKDGVEVNQSDLETKSKSDSRNNQLKVETEDEVQQESDAIMVQQNGRGTKLSDSSDELHSADNIEVRDEVDVSGVKKDTTQVKSEKKTARSTGSTDETQSTNTDEKQNDERKPSSVELPSDVLETATKEKAQSTNPTDETQPENNIYGRKKRDLESELGDNQASTMQKTGQEASSMNSGDELQTVTNNNTEVKTESVDTKSDIEEARSTTLTETQSSDVRETTTDERETDNDTFKTEQNTNENESTHPTAEPQSVVEVKQEDTEDIAEAVTPGHEDIRQVNTEEQNQPSEKLVQVKQISDLEAEPVSQDELTRIEIGDTADSGGGTRSENIAEDAKGATDVRNESPILATHQTAITENDDHANETAATDKDQHSNSNKLETEQTATSHSTDHLTTDTSKNELQTGSSSRDSQEEQADVNQDKQELTKSTSKAREVVEIAESQLESTSEVKEVTDDVKRQSESSSDVKEVTNNAKMHQSESTNDEGDVTKDTDHQSESTTEVKEVTINAIHQSESTNQVREVTQDARYQSESTHQAREVTEDAKQQSESVHQTGEVTEDAGRQSESINETTGVTNDTLHQSESTYQVKETTENITHQSESITEAKEVTKGVERKSETTNKARKIAEDVGRESEIPNRASESHRTQSDTIIKRNDSGSASHIVTKTEKRENDENDPGKLAAGQTGSDANGRCDQVTLGVETGQRLEWEIENEHINEFSKKRTDDLVIVVEKPLSYGIPVRTESHDQLFAESEQHEVASGLEPLESDEQIDSASLSQSQPTEGNEIDPDEANADGDENADSTATTPAMSTTEEAKQLYSTVRDEKVGASSTPGIAATTDTGKEESQSHDSTVDERTVIPVFREGSTDSSTNLKEVDTVARDQSGESVEHTEESTTTAAAISSANEQQTASAAQDASQNTASPEVHSSRAEKTIHSSHHQVSSVNDNSSRSNETSQADQNDNADKVESQETNTSSSIETVISSDKYRQSESFETNASTHAAILKSTESNGVQSAMTTSNQQNGSHKATQATNSQIDAATRQVTESYAEAPTRQQSTSTEHEDDDDGSSIEIEETHIIEETYTETTKRYKEISIHETTVVETEIIEYTSEQLTASNSSDAEEDSEKDGEVAGTPTGDDGAGNSASDDGLGRRRSSASSNDVVMKIGNRDERETEMMTASEPGRGRELISASNVSVKLDINASSGVVRNGNAISGNLKNTHQQSK